LTFDSDAQLSEIGASAFPQLSRLRSVSSPSSVKIVFKFGFLKCFPVSALTSAYGSKHARIDSFAFSCGSMLTSIHAPRSAESVSNSVSNAAPRLDHWNLNLVLSVLELVQIHLDLVPDAYLILLLMMQMRLCFG
jgi:hypothetical protein